MTLTKSHVVEVINQELGYPKNQCTEWVEILLEIVKKKLASNEDVLISGFGKFCIKEKQRRRGRNPATGENLTLDRRRVVTFKCSHILRERINT